MKKIMVSALIFAMILTLSITVYAKNGKSRQAGKSNIGHLYLNEKDPETWEIAEDGAWGKMKYNLAGPEFQFVFNGHDLEPGMEFALIYYPDPWPGDGLICLGTGTADEDGNVHIMGSADTGDLPAEDDDNSGAKIWLVLSDDVDCENQQMVGWSPTEYLFEHNLITFECTDTAMAPPAPESDSVTTTWAKVKRQ